MAEDNKLNLKGILKGIVFSLITTVVLVFVIALISYFTDIGDNIISILLFASSVISVFLGGVFVAKNSSRNGILHGGLIGLGYFVIILIASFVIKKQFDISPHLITMLLADICGAMLGGILGINSKNWKNIKKTLFFFDNMCYNILSNNIFLEDKTMKHVKTLNKATLKNSAKHGGCGECQTSCQSACKTSCTVANQKCERA